MRTVDAEISLGAVEEISAFSLQSAHIISYAHGHSFADILCQISVKYLG